jgi:type IV secretion system protein VirB10
MSDSLPFDESLPLVGEDSGNRGLWLGLGGIAAAGILLFVVLESNRQPATPSAIASPRDFATASAQRSELAIPDMVGQSGYQSGSLPPSNATTTQILTPLRQQKLPPVRLTTVNPRTDNGTIEQPYTRPQTLPEIQPQSLASDLGRSAPAIVYEAAFGIASADGVSDLPNSTATKAFATGGGDRTYLVSQGTLIFAVLETAIDSTQAGQVRAMISKHVYNALGTQILIPKGSRIFGEYKGELGAGQNRAQIVWTRLIRPDGATISLDSPASDQLGRAGVKGDVNSHFGERLLGALLQSTIDFGVLAASRAATNGSGVLIALPSNGQGGGAQVIQPTPKPTLKVKHGTRISVFVSRDLDFSAVE